MMKIGRKGLALIKSFEGFVPYVYDDLIPPRPVKGKLVYREWDGGKVRGTLTIGYGHTDAAKHPLKIAQGLRITEEKALEVLDVDLDECEQAVNKLVKVPLSQGQFDALVSFAFNCGVGNLKKLIAPLNKGDYATTRAKFDLYVKSKGKTLAGLARRRDAEQALWDDRYDEVKIPDEPVHHTADVDEPKPKPMTKSTVGNGAGVSIGLGTLQAASEATGAVREIKTNTSEAGLFDLIGALAAKPGFWVGVAVVVVGAFIWWRCKQMQALL